MTVLSLGGEELKLHRSLLAEIYTEYKFIKNIKIFCIFVVKNFQIMGSDLARRIDRLDVFLAQQQLSDRQACIIAGLSNGLLGKSRRTGKDLSLASAERIIAVFPELSRDWLLAGEGEMWSHGDSGARSAANEGFADLNTVIQSLKQHPAIQRSVASLRDGEGGLLAAVSGGADSVAMLLLLLVAGRKVVVANCNFHLRGAESDRDSRFVAQLCRHLNVELIPLVFDVAAYRNTHNCSLEMACRDLRYDAFRKILKDRELQRIVTGHNADDQAETLLLNLMRGSGIAGLKAMEEDTGEILRPLLGVTRREIDAWLAHCGQGFVTDSSNLIPDVDRNFLRLRLIPLLEERWPQARKALALTARNVAGAVPFYHRGLELSLTEPRLLSRATLAGEWSDAAMLTLIHEFLAPYGSSRSIDEEVAACAQASLPAGKVWKLEKGMAVTCRRGIYIDIPLPEPRLYSQRVNTAGLSPDQLLDIIKRDGNDAFYSSMPHFAFSLRTPEAGEKMQPLGMRGNRLVSDILAEADIPVTRRATYPLLADTAGNCVWLPGVKRSSLHVINPRVVPEALYRYTLSYPATGTGTSYEARKDAD